jgi:hypothetical protein
MPVQMIELEEVQMIEVGDEALEATLGGFMPPFTYTYTVH